MGRLLCPSGLYIYITRPGGGKGGSQVRAVEPSSADARRLHRDPGVQTEIDQVAISGRAIARKKMPTDRTVFGFGRQIR
jgi:hypothetical protein